MVNKSNASQILKRDACTCFNLKDGCIFLCAHTVNHIDEAKNLQSYLALLYSCRTANDYHRGNENNKHSKATNI